MYFNILYRWRRHYKSGMYNSNLAGAGAGANGYGYGHGSAYGGSAMVKGQDLEEQVRELAELHLIAEEPLYCYISVIYSICHTHV